MGAGATEDVFVHLSGVLKAGLSNLRKGQEIDFEFFDNKGRAAAENLQMNDKNPRERSEQNFKRSSESALSKMRKRKPEPSLKKRTGITRAALELALVEIVRGSDPQCKSLAGIIIERAVPGPHGGPNWIVKGIKYGKVERERCSALISRCVEESQRDFEVSDWAQVLIS